jgi:hypothetical protein
MPQVYLMQHIATLLQQLLSSLHNHFERRCSYAKACMFTHVHVVYMTDHQDQSKDY